LTKKQTIKDLGEFKSIEKITRDFIYRPELVKVGIGDDGAVVHTRPEMDEIISTDTMVEGVHFTHQTMSAFDVGFKLCASNVSDIAAMGGQPTGLVVSVTVPSDLPAEWLENCYEGIRAACKYYRMNLLGGDMTGSPHGIVLTGTVIGEVPLNTAVTRRQAQVGDVVCVTGTVGDAGAGLEAIYRKWESLFPHIVQKHQRPLPSPNLAMKIRECGASSMNDISDGLSSELYEIAQASQVNMSIVGEQIPLSQETIELSEKVGVSPIHYALVGGEDYELVFTIKEAKLSLLTQEPIHVIGRVESAGEGVVSLTYQGEKKVLEAKGFCHFKS